MREATAQESYMAIFGASATQWEWWHGEENIGWDGDWDSIPDEWKVRLTAEDGNGGPDIVKDISHSDLIAAAKRIIAYPNDLHVNPDSPLAAAAHDLVYHGGDEDFDADTADSIIQVAVLGEIVYG